MAVKKAKKTVVQPAWQQNFRNRETLPDIKVVRTDFLLNFCAIVAVVALAGYLAYNELNIKALTTDVAQLQQRVQSETRRNAENIKLSGEFTEISTRVSEATSFGATRYRPQDFLLELSKVLPREIVITQVDFTTVEETLNNKNFLYTRISLTGNAFGTSEEGPLIVDNFKESLESLATLEKADTIEMPSFNREAAQDLFTFNIRINLRDATGMTAAERRAANPPRAQRRR